MRSMGTSTAIAQRLDVDGGDPRPVTKLESYSDALLGAAMRCSELFHQQRRRLDGEYGIPPTDMQAVQQRPQGVAQTLETAVRMMEALESNMRDMTALA